MRRTYFSYGGKSLHPQSHGESFLALFLERFGLSGCNHLRVQRDGHRACELSGLATLSGDEPLFEKPGSDAGETVLRLIKSISA